MQSLKLMLDTHTLLWVIGKTDKLSKKVVQEIQNPGNEVIVSAVSLWEIALKHSIGKLEVDFDIKKIPDYCAKMDIHLIPLDPIDALESLNLPKKENHKDPFDKMLIYQCIKYGYTLVSKDKKIEVYAENGLMYIW
jgi:PIN domain nuclease of toxin-antitoxin system